MTDMIKENPPRLALVVAFSGTGGVEGNVFKLVPALLDAGVAVDLLGIFKMPIPEVLQFSHPHYRLIDLEVRHSLLIVPALMRYFKANDGVPMLVAKDRAIRMAIIARKLAGTHDRLIGQLNTHLSAALAEKPVLQRWWRTLPMRWFYPHIDGVVAVSSGVAEDTHQLTGLSRDRITVIRNPVIDADMFRKSLLPVGHPWFDEGELPVILGAGRLTRQKDFDTLIRSFAQVLENRECRLVILGEGPDLEPLQQLIMELDLQSHVLLAGHVQNPYAYMSRSRLFVLSSRWEGSGNVLTEAMALGVPVVSTDCPSGPAEMLEEGRHGPLIPVGDPAALASAIIRTLDSPANPEQLRSAVREYAVEQSAQRYIQALGLA